MTPRSVRRPRPTSVAAVLAALALLAPAGCAAPEAPVAAPATCAKADLPLLTPGAFTVGTDQPAYPPWFVDDDPSNGKGYESAVVYAVAEELGFTPAEVVWVTVPFNSAVVPGDKPFDVDINQVSISEERRQAVDFSSGYYDVRQTVITTRGSALDGVTTVAGLASARLGAQVGTTSLTAISEQIRPTAAPLVFDSNDQAVQALQNGQIDGLVVDLPTGFYMVGAQLDDGVIVGQLPAASGAVEQLGMVLDKGSPLTACVSGAVDALRADGRLAALADEYLSAGGAPELG